MVGGDTADTKQIAAVANWFALLKNSAVGNECLYMILDAAHDPRIYPALEKSVHTRCCLFSEEQVANEVKAAAPFLVKIKRLDDFIGWCLREGLRHHWMVFFASNEVHVSELRLHFKRFSLAQTPDGKRYFFRYYDPRVLPIFLAASEQRERQEFFRHCRAFWIPTHDPTGETQLLQIEADGRQVLLQSLAEILPQTGVVIETRV